MANLETIASQDFGGHARRTNAKRLWIPPNLMNYATGTWTFTVASNVISMDKTTTDETSTIYIPFPVQFSMGAYQSGSAVVDRGVRVIGIEFLCLIGTADLDAVPTIKIIADTQAASAGALGTSTEVTSTKVVGAVTAAATLRRISALIATGDRTFVTDLKTFHCEVGLNAATTTVLKSYGAVWHYEIVED